MSQVEIVALWAGLLIGVASTVLALVTIVLAISAERRSERVSAQTIKSLQKIETTIERQSQDTGQLIKAAWDKLLGVVGTPSPTLEGSVHEIVAGITAELRTESNSPEVRVALDERLQERLERSISALERVASSSPSGNRDQSDNEIDPRGISSLLDRLSPPALELVRILDEESLHLTYSQYNELLQTDSEIAGALQELRNCDLVIPLTSATHEPVYWFPPWLSKMISPALVMVARGAPNTHSLLRRRLSAVGYPEDSSD